MNYDSEIADAAAAYPDVPADWIRAFIGAETSFNAPPDTWEPKAHEYAYGPMQVLLSTARGLGFPVGAAGLRDSAMNIMAGTALIHSWIPVVGDNFDRAYSAYNSGDPDRYLSSTQVAANVARAREWLNRSGVAGGAFPWIVAAIVGLWWWKKR